MCPADADKFVSSARVRPTLYPISAINFIESEADMPAYVEKMKLLNRGSEIVEQLISEAEEKFQTAMTRLAGLKEEMTKIVNKEYDAIIAKMKSLHTGMTTKLVNCKNDIHIAKVTKEAMLSSASQSIVESGGKKTVELYVGLIKDVCKSTQQSIQQTSIPPDADHYLQSLFGVPQPSEDPNLPVETITPGTKHSRSPSDTQDTPSPPSAHQTSEPARRRNRFFPNKDKKSARPNRDADGNRVCQSCDKKCDDLYHECNEESYCLDCFERLVAESCFRGRAVCPGCQQVPKEIYRNRGLKECGFCYKKMRINEIAHWCGQDGALSCEKCLARVGRLGKCKNCGVTLKTSC